MTQVNIGGLDIAVHHGGLPGVKLGELFADFERNHGGAVRVYDLIGGEDFGQAPTFDVLHGDEEITVEIAIFVDFDHARIQIVQFLLDCSTPSLGFQNQARRRIAAALNY